jgi:hypothetical protein
MEWWITTKQLLPRQDARSKRMRNQPNGELGHLMANKDTIWAQQCITLCQNVYISTTASKRIVDTLEFSPHKSTMPQLSSTEILIMAANDMTNALKTPHPASVIFFAHKL